MRRIAQRVVELESKRREPLVFMNIGLDDLAAYGYDFGLHPGGCLVETGKHDLGQLLAFLGFGHPQILVGVEARVDVYAPGLLQRIRDVAVGLV